MARSLRVKASQKRDKRGGVDERKRSVVVSGVVVSTLLCGGATAFPTLTPAAAAAFSSFCLCAASTCTRRRRLHLLRLRVAFALFRLRLRRLPLSPPPLFRNVSFSTAEFLVESKTQLKCVKVDVDIERAHGS
jgi:hypothetical protein